MVGGKEVAKRGWVGLLSLKVRGLRWVEMVGDVSWPPVDHHFA